ncbi:helicase HerA-like domain-containing protein [Zafaria sp. J156]|uniref:helicase HerA-like domain-containing protein n=1 Tax=Zafaria sp. J156 TaxID=3116490 RepID=UPI002E789429|nr:helicase HerA-like domain-containing protein [Zafaria sp. J156]MEE1622357.1 helicase HerA-like domain-containing protein [Zafaria sp. J156]
MAKRTPAEHVELIRNGYVFEGPSMGLGAAVVDGAVHPEAQVRLPLGMMNRHGLVAGATGTGKTITLQVMAEQLSENGVPVFLADVKGDLTGLSTPGAGGEKLLARTAGVGMDWSPADFPVEYYALGGDGTGVPVRATVSAFGPLLLSRVMDLNETQESSLQLVFHYADQKELELYDLKDLRAVVQHLTSDAGKAELAELGGLSKATAGVILRELVTLEAQGLDRFFGEPEFDTAELLRTAPDGRGVISCLELPTLLQKPLVFSTFLMWLLADLFAELPEVGDPEKPKLVFFLDEAHLLFRGASKAFLESITTTVRLIRSKGVGVFFVTQTPKDVPADVLGQLANRVQHALRAFTPDDAKALKATVSTFPVSDYDLSAALTQAGTGEAIVTVMNEKGAPTPVAWTRMWSPRSTMGASEASVVERVVAESALLQVYGTPVDRESAFEKLKGAAGTPGTTPEPSSPATGGSVAGHVPGRGQSQADIDAEARRIEEEILGRPSTLPPTTPGRAPSSSPKPAPAPAPAPSRVPEQNPVMDFALQAAGALGKELMRGMFGTKRRRR